MATYSTAQFKNGLKLLIDGNPCSIINNEIVKPGKGQAFNRVKLMDLANNKVLEKTYKSGESVEAADVMELEMQYLYQEGTVYNFMEPKTFEQYAIDADNVGDVALFLVEQDTCTIVLWDNNPISVTPQNHVILEVADTDPGLKGDTAGTGGKAATMNTGAAIRVPLFVNIGDKLKIDTRTKEYVGRA